MSVKISPEYEALGIHPDTMTCVAVMSEADAKAYVWALATEGVTAIASRDANTPLKPKAKVLWHVAVPGGLAYNPRAYFTSITGPASVACTSTREGQHPMEREEKS